MLVIVIFGGDWDDGWKFVFLMCICYFYTMFIFVSKAKELVFTQEIYNEFFISLAFVLMSTYPNVYSEEEVAEIVHNWIS